MFIGTCADILPIRNIFSPVSGWKADSYTFLALQTCSSVVPGGSLLCLFTKDTGRLFLIISLTILQSKNASGCLEVAGC